MQFSGDIGTTGLDSNDSHGRRQRQIEVPHASKKNWEQIRFLNM